MVRKFRPFSKAVIDREMGELPAEDRRPLTYAMENYQMDSGSHYKIKNYGEGLMMITDSGRGQGRCLFFKQETVVTSEGQEERLIALLVYKKESDNVPQSVLKTARSRMKDT